MSDPQVVAGRSGQLVLAFARSRVLDLQVTLRSHRRRFALGATSLASA